MRPRGRCAPRRPAPRRRSPTRRPSPPSPWRGPGVSAGGGGRAHGLPAFPAWEVWNEPNISLYLTPQFVDGQPFAPGWYRTMVNTYYDAVKAVVPSAVIVAGGTAPFLDNTPEVKAVDPDWGPLSFMRSLFCLSATLQPTCATP